MYLSSKKRGIKANLFPNEPIATHFKPAIECIPHRWEAMFLLPVILIRVSNRLARPDGLSQLKQFRQIYFDYAKYLVYDVSDHEILARSTNQFVSGLWSPKQ
jgi:hypothetical protein